MIVLALSGDESRQVALLPLLLLLFILPPVSLSPDNTALLPSHNIHQINIMQIDFFVIIDKTTVKSF